MGRVAGDDDDEVGLGRAGKLTHLDGGLWEAFGQPLEVVNKFCAFAQIEERMVVFAFLAAQLANAGNAECNHGQR